MSESTATSSVTTTALKDTGQKAGQIHADLAAEAIWFYFLGTCGVCKGGPISRALPRRPQPDVRQKQVESPKRPEETQRFPHNCA